MDVIAELIEGPEQFVTAPARARRFFASPADGGGSRLAWFRGQADASWFPRPKVMRTERVPTHNRLYFEMSVASRFVTKARTRHSECPDTNDPASWLFLMQHYGVPTRLLDWSESFLVAAWFAVSDPGLAQMDGAIWALAPGHLNKSIGYIPTARSIEGKVSTALAFSMEAPGNLAPREKELVPMLSSSAVALVPDEVDLRMLLQQSTFTIHGGQSDLDTHGFLDGSLLKFTIAANDKPKVVGTLRDLGIRQSTVYPDLTNLGIELSDSIEGYPAAPDDRPPHE